MHELKRLASMARCFDVDVEVVTPAEAGRRWPLMRTDDLVGALWLPRDGRTNPIDTTLALARGARQGGATILENTAVTAIRVENGRVTGVSTTGGEVTCEFVVNCAGMWAREIGRMAGVTVPLHASEHFYIVTEPMAGVTPDLPVLRDTDGYIYVREEVGGLLMGGFEPVAKPWGMEGIPADFAFSLLPEDWEHFQVLMEQAMHPDPRARDRAGAAPRQRPRELHARRPLPPGRGAGVPKLLRGRRLQLDRHRLGGGRRPGGGGVDRRRRAADGSLGRRHPAGGAVPGQPALPARPHGGDGGSALRRALAVSCSRRRRAACARACCTTGSRARGACFGVVMGWERANWYATAGMEAVYRYSYGRQNWFPCSAAEHRAVREAVGLFDQSSFCKLRLEGPDALAVLQRLCANDVDVPPGRLVYTQMLNSRGGIEADLTVTRLSADAFFVVTGAAAATHDTHWIRRHIGAARAVLTDVTSAQAVLGVMGPRSRELLARLTDADLSHEAFPFLASREIWLGSAPVRASRVTYVGELGWELYVPTELAAGVYDAVVAAGEGLGLRHAGYHAMDSLRIEKAYRSWGHDIGGEDTPFEAGLGFAVRLDKRASFTGRDALLAQRGKPLTRRLAVFVLDDPEPLLYHDEPIWRDGALVGRIASGAYGHTLGRAVGLGWVALPDGVTEAFVASGRWEVEIACERVPARAQLAPPYDPKSLRVRG